MTFLPLTTLVGWIVIAAAGAIFAIGALFSLLGMKGTPDPGYRTRVLLVLLRVAIGWHFFVEGMDKLRDPDWTGAGYLREAVGPLAPEFRSLAGDPVVKKLSDGGKAIDMERQNYVEAVASFYHLDPTQTLEIVKALGPVKTETERLLTTQPKLVERSGAYPPPFREEMTMKERIELYEILQQDVRTAENEMSRYGSEKYDAWKTAKARATKWHAELQKDLAMFDRETKRTVRLALLDLVAAKLPSEKKAELSKAITKARAPFDKEYIEALIDSIPLDPAKTAQETAAQTKNLLEDARRWREQSDQDLLAQTDQALADSLKLGDERRLAAIPADKKRPDDFGEKIAKLVVAAREKLADWDQIDHIAEKQEEKISDVYRAFFFTMAQKNDANDQAFLKDPLVKQVREDLLEKRLKDQSNVDPLPIRVTPPLAQWTLLDLSDRIVMYGVLAVGVALLAGVCTRMACLAGAGFLLMFFLAMPPLPGWPDNPKAEGHYLYINKNFVEMLALLALATTRSGRWFGIDGLLQLMCPKCCWRKKQECVKM